MNDAINGIVHSGLVCVVVSQGLARRELNLYFIKNNLSLARRDTITISKLKGVCYAYDYP
jgi:hypothetical protein